MAKAPVQYAVFWLKAIFPVTGEEGTSLTDLDTSIKSAIDEFRGLGEVEQAQLTVPSHTIDYSKTY